MKRLLLPILSALLAAPVAADDMDVVRQNYVGYLTAAGADRSSNRMLGALGELEFAARHFTAAEFLLSDGSWADIDYSETPSGSWSPWDHTRRLVVMAKAYKTPGQALYRDPQLLAHIRSALGKVTDYYGMDDFPSGNWWFWTMGVPMDLGPILVLMSGEIDPKLAQDLTAAISLRIGSSPFKRGISGPVPAGQNLVWSAHNHLALAILTRDAARMGLVRDAITSVAQPSTGEGMKSDRSFHQHGAQLYTGGYGGAFANDVARYALISRGTAFSMPQASLATFSDYIADGIAWSLYGNHFDVSVLGREVARSSTTGYHGIAALLQAAHFDSPRQAEIRAAAARMLQSWQWGLPTELAGLAAIIERGGVQPAWPTGFRHYYASDFSVHRRPNWYASIKMFSTRTKSGEGTNGENLLGSRQSDGRFHLVREGTDYFGRNIVPTLDWSRLPGITVEQRPGAADASYGYGTRNLAGGTGDGRTGVSAMDLAPINSTLSARKSWFFFEDAIVFLTNSITSRSEFPIETIVNQWPLNSPNAAVVSGNGWSVLEGVGYYFPSGGNLRSTRDTRTGTWASLGASTDTTERSTTFHTIWFDHGTHPNHATAEYVIVPDTTPERMASWVASNPISILANTFTVSAARDHRDQTLGIVFWTAGVFDGIQSSAAAIVHITPKIDGMIISVSDPTNGSGTMSLVVPGRYTGTNAVTGARATTITIPRDGGKTFTVTLKNAVPARRRAVSR